MLGQSFTNELYRAGAPPCNIPTRQELDVTNELAVRRFITQTQPSLIINTTVMRSVDRCELNPQEAYQINTQAVEYIVNASKALKTKIIHISTDYVFDGYLPFKKSYQETDIPNPLQVYGKTKLDSEKFVLDAGGYVYRVQWLFGSTRENFLDWIVNSILTHTQIPISTDQMGCPCSTAFVAQLIVRSFQKTLPGLYHISHDNFCTRYECASYIASLFKKAPSDCFHKVSGNFGIALRPMNTCMDNSKLKKGIQDHSLGTWQGDVFTYVSTRYAEKLNENI
jgi:dTDP-4-dehydrorhamnose reductase